MLEKLLNNKIKVLLVVALVMLLALVRAFEDLLFYDPFSGYFKNDYLNLPFPEYDGLAWKSWWVFGVGLLRFNRF